jgi:hypothetical protein
MLSETRAPANVGDTSASGYDIVLEGTSEEKTATASATWTSHDSTETYQLKLTGPLNRMTKEAVPFTLAGLPGNGSAEFTYQHILLAHSRDAEAQELLCELADRGLEDCGDNAFLDEARRPTVRDLRNEYSQASAQRKAVLCRIVGKRLCFTHDFESVQMRDAYFAMTNAPKSLALWGLTAGVSRSTFTYLTAVDLDAQEESHSNWKLGAHVGLYRPTTGYLRAGVAHLDTYRPAEATASEICQAVDGAEATRCREIVIGAPTNVRSTIASLEWRYFLPGGKVAISPSISRDLENRVTALILPVYFLGSEGGLTGGARIGWESEKEAITFAIFVGAALKVVD